MSNKVSTAEEFCKTFQPTCKTWQENFHQTMVEFAKLHVKTALEKAAEEATVTPIDHEEISEGSFRPIWGVDEDSILKAYPEDLIK